MGGEIDGDAEATDQTVSVAVFSGKPSFSPGVLSRSRRWRCVCSCAFCNSGAFESWKHASVIPILKPGKPRSAADSYRPISLLPVLSKLAERLILSRLNNHLTTNKIQISQQHGFRPQLSTSHQLLRVVEYSKSGFKEKKCTGAVFLDIQKAFDRVWHTGLLYKLIKINSPPQLILIIKSFLINRSFAVRVNDTPRQSK
ncbi:RNA-directed DNA polymerase from mobile element jockey [Trichonephila clavipes]|nr:RNA-directed DNA polymerase from mobile element jockey [Trichonephila clavipes]